MQTKNIVIIGGGLSGLATAEILAKHGYKVTVLEKAQRVGGLARSFLHNGTWVPEAYHHVMKPDTVTLDYFKQFGLDNDLKWINSSQALWYDYEHYLFSKPQHVLRFKPFNLIEKLRILKFGVYCLFPHDWQKLDLQKCDDWLNRKIGRRATDILFKNLIEIKFNIPLAEASTAWLARRLHQSTQSGDWYAYPRGGMQQLIDKLVESIENNGGKIVTSFEVHSIGSNKIAGVDLSTGNSMEYDAPVIVSSIPPMALSNMYDFPDELVQQLRSVKYKAFVSFVCGSNDRRTPYYWNIVLKPQLCFGGIFNHSVFSEPGTGEQIYYLFTYTEHTSEFYHLDDTTLYSKYMKDLNKLWPGFKADWYRIFKYRYSQPVFSRNFVNLPIELGTGNIFLTGVYRGHPAPRTMASALHQGEITANHIINKYA